MTTARVTVRSSRLSLRVDLRVFGVLAVLGALSLVALTLNIGRGEFPIAPVDVLAALAGAGDGATSFIVLDLRLPRALTAVLAGAAFGIAGAILQDLARNPLVSPDIIGVTGGASLAAITLIVFGGGSGLVSIRSPRSAGRSPPERRCTRWPGAAACRATASCSSASAWRR